MSEETKRKISLAQKGKPRPNEPWNKGIKGVMKAWNKGKKIGKKSEAIRKIHSDAAKKSGVGKWMKGRKLSEEHKKRIGGRKPCNWIEDRSKLSRMGEARNSPAHREWSRQVKNRDGWKCKISNNDCSGRVVAHHILTWKDYPELRYEVNNGITLCYAHHPRKRNDEKKLAPLFQRMVLVRA